MATTYYETLGLTPDCPSSAVREAYVRLAGEHHPDHGGDPSKMAEIIEAYKGLADRRAYNTILAFRLQPCKDCRGRGTRAKGFASRVICQTCAGIGFFPRKK